MNDITKMSFVYNFQNIFFLNLKIILKLYFLYIFFASQILCKKKYEKKFINNFIDNKENEDFLFAK